MFYRTLIIKKYELLNDHVFLIGDLGEQTTGTIYHNAIDEENQITIRCFQEEIFTIIQHPWFYEPENGGGYKHVIHFASYDKIN